MAWLGYFSEQTSEIQKTLAALVSENERLALDNRHQFADLIASVLGVISELRKEVKEQKPIVEITKASLSTMSDAGTPSNTMENLSSKLLTLAERTSITASDQMLVKSLWFERINQRQENVALSYKKTFKWALDPSSPTRLQNWLRTRNGIYWITGKAGSGKSTLMKYLIQNAIDEAKEWAGTKK